MSDMKQILVQITIRLDIAKENISKFEDRAIETFQNGEKKNRESMSCGTTMEDPIFMLFQSLKGRRT